MRYARTRSLKLALAVVVALAPAVALAVGTMSGADPADVSGAESTGGVGLLSLVVIVLVLAGMSLMAEYTLPLAGALVAGAVVGGIFGQTAGWITAASIAAWFLTNKHKS